MNSQNILNNLKNVFKKAGKIALSFYNQNFDQAQKEDCPVTQADLEINKFLIDELSQFGNVGIFSEELKEDKSYLEQDKYFIIDPLDGTKDFVHKTGDFSVMLALIENNEPILGIVYKPIGDELYYAYKGGGAWLEKNDKKTKLSVSKETDFSKMKLVVSRFHLRDVEKDLKEKIEIGDFEQKGSAGLKMCEVARGDAHIYVSTTNRTGEWDSAPGSLIIKESGGKITDIFGKPLKFGKEDPYNLNGFVVSNGTRHNEIINELQAVI